MTYSINELMRNHTRNAPMLTVLLQTDSVRRAGRHNFAGDLNTADRCCKRSPQTLQPTPIENDLRQFDIRCTSRGPGRLAIELKHVEKLDQRGP